MVEALHADVSISNRELKARADSPLTCTTSSEGISNRELKDLSAPPRLIASITSCISNRELKVSLREKLYALGVVASQIEN